MSILTVPPRHHDGQALAESLKTNARLGRLELQHNNIGGRGAEAPAAECMLVGAEG